MSFIDLIYIELKKLKRSKIIIIMLISIIMIMISAVSSAKLNLHDIGSIKPNYNMFVQSMLSFTVFMLPLSLIVITVLICQTEYKNRGILKMLSLPIDIKKLAFAKFLILVFVAALETGLFFILYIPSEILAGRSVGVNLSVPTGYLFMWCMKVLVASLPMTAFFWMICACIKKPAASLGLGFLFTVPIILACNTKYWWLYAMDYPTRIIMFEQARLSGTLTQNVSYTVLWIGTAILIMGAALFISSIYFGKSERE